VAAIFSSFQQSFTRQMEHSFMQNLNIKIIKMAGMALPHGH
jgi:hypothetical protein